MQQRMMMISRMRKRRHKRMMRGMRTEAGSEIYKPTNNVDLSYS